MSLALRILLMIFSVGFVYFVLKRIHKAYSMRCHRVFCILHSSARAEFCGRIPPLLTRRQNKRLPYAAAYGAFIKIFSMAAKISNLEDKINKLSYEEAKRRMQEQEVEGAQNKPGTMDERKAV